MQRRRLLILGLVAAIGTAMLSAVLLAIFREPAIEEDLRDKLLEDVPTHYSSYPSGVLVPSIVDQLIGFKAVRHRVVEANTIDDGGLTYPDDTLCLRIRVVYRDPGKLSVYSPGSPIEDFLYLAGRHENDWRVALLAQSGMDKPLPSHDCKDYEVSN